MKSVLKNWSDVPITFGVEIAQLLLCKKERHAVMRLIKTDGLPVRKIGREWLFDREEFRNWYDSKRGG